MDLNELLDLILFSGSKLSRIEGKRLFQSNLVSDIKGKKIEKIYHIYGKVKDEKIDKYYNAHIKVDLVNKKVLSGNCSCENFLENKELHREFKCKHMMAVAYKFYILAKKNENKNTEKKVIPIKKVKLKIEPRIKHIKEAGKDKYIIEFWIGEQSLALMKSINEFIYSMENKRFLILNDNFTYNPHKHILNEEAERIIDYLNEKITIKDSNEKKIVGRNIEISGSELKEFLSLLDENKSFIINYNYINYKVEVIKDLLPVHFNVKLKDNKIVVTSTNKMPVPLNEELEVFLYDRRIYIPKEKTIKYLKVIYKSLMDKGQVVLINNEENLIKILKLLYCITKDISLGEGIKRLIGDIIKPEFYFNKCGDELYCKVNINYGIGSVTLLKDINNFDFIRDIRYEEKIVMELEKLKFIKDYGKFKFIGNDEDIYELLSVKLKSLVSEGKVFLSKEFKNLKLITGDDFNYSFMEDGAFDFNMKDFTIKELDSALMAMKNKKGFYKTKDNNYLDLRDKKVIKILNILDSLQVSENLNNEKVVLDKNKLLYLEESLKNNTTFDKGIETVNSITANMENKEEAQVPKDLNGTLRNYQMEGFKWLNEISTLKVGGILADEMGLGKTIQIISFLLSKKGSKSIVITPTSLIYNWRDEFEKFAPSLNVAIVHGDKKQREKLLENEYDVIVTTYGLIKNDYESYKDKEFDYCVIDEAQNIKNPKAQNSKFVKSIKAECKIALSGTPMENNLMELWSIFDYIMPGYLLSEEKFKEKFIAESNFEELRKLINPFILRRLKKDVILELPDKIEKKYMVEMSKKQKEIYNSYITEVRQELKKGEESGITVFSYLTKLRQLCLDPSLLLEDYNGGSAKIEAVLQIVEDALKEERKLLIFSQFTSVLQKLGKELESKFINYLYLDGSTSPKKRVELVKKFNEEDESKIFLISLKAGGTGLNLTSSDLVVHFDPWWNPAIEDQATDRAHRIGQKNVVEVIKLIAKDSVEEKIIKLQEDKRELINKVITGEEIDSNNIGKLTNEEIIDLFM